MSRVVVQCSQTDCREPAAYKIAARWSDGRVAELKTYAFACQDHVGVVFRDSERGGVNTPRRRANRSRRSRSIATNRVSATVYCNGCGDWKKTIDREDGRDGPKWTCSREQRRGEYNRRFERRCTFGTNGATVAAIARRNAAGFLAFATVQNRWAGTI